MALPELKILIGMHRMINELDRNTARIAASYDLTLGQFAVLEALYHKGDLMVGEVQEKVLSTTGTIAVIINNLEKRELIERRKNKEDRRISIIHLTDRGKDIIAKAYPENEEMIIDFFDIYSDEEKAEMLNLLNRYKEHNV